VRCREEKRREEKKRKEKRRKARLINSRWFSAVHYDEHCVVDCRAMSSRAPRPLATALMGLLPAWDK
jgi:hypothetical protein